ncbi:MAG: inositol monophosphatase family protein, partial [Steroidobacteraceae bacterium]
MQTSNRIPSPQLAAALEAARAADAIIGPLYRSNLAVEIKADRSPVTEADRCAEAAIHAVLAGHFPDYGFFGEEGGQHAMDAENIWLVDPLDGTKSFVRDTPFFSTQIALLRRGEFVLGVSSACAAGETAWAERGAGAWLNGQRIQVSRKSAL